ncbi:hypothetical protein, partial [Klebsiella pneumoniae]|uniref:hypothetical protein n=1 Tax=Klebsiella pneumoniae TaxID=573 RepID=UPI0013D14C16
MMVVVGMTQEDGLDVYRRHVPDFEVNVRTASVGSEEDRFGEAWASSVAVPTICPPAGEVPWHPPLSP